VKGLILLVEDPATFCRTYKVAIEGAGFAVIEAEDGELGWKLVQSEKPSLVVLDLLLPKMNGFDVLKNIRSHETTRDIPGIVLSLLGEKVDIQKGLDLGASDYTVKGFHSPREAVRKIEAVLANRARARSITTCRLFLAGGRDDAAKLQQEIGLTDGFRCSICSVAMNLDRVPDYSRTDGHWFAAHLVCPGCQRGF
jgi:DNA-binding response OmpR family regulator